MKHTVILAAVTFLLLISLIPTSVMSEKDGFDGSRIIHEGNSYKGDIDWTPFFRDLDRNGVDDLIDDSPEEMVDIYIKLETIPTDEDMEILLKFLPDIYYRAKYTNTVITRNVEKSLIYSKLRYLDPVTFIESIPPVIPFLDVSTEAIKAKPGEIYHDVWEELGITGSGVNIAVLDGGSNDHETTADMGHIALDDIDDDPLTYDPKFIAGWDFETLTGGEFINPHGDPAIGHGTHVAGTALGTGGAGEDSANRGVAPGAQLIDMKVITDAGFGGTILPAMEWCVDNKDRDWITSDNEGIQIMSMSLGTQGESDGSDSMSQTANVCVDEGIIVVVAAGNNGNQGYITPPAAADKVICVGSIDDKNTIPRNDDSVSGFSNKGPRDSDGDSDRYDELKPDVVAPGSNIMAPRADSGVAFVAMSGTSMATPHVSGVVALILEANPDLTPLQVKEILHESSEARGTVYDPELSEKYSTNFGYGIVDAYQAVLMSIGNSDIEIESTSMENTQAGKDRYDEGDDVRLVIALNELEGTDVDSYDVEIRDTDSSELLVTITGSLVAGGHNEHEVVLRIDEGGQLNLTTSVVNVIPGDVDLSNNNEDTTLYANYLPHASLTANETDVMTFNEILFSGSGSWDEDGSVAEHRFIFGDSNESGWTNQVEVAHEYEDDGTYDVELLVRDDNGVESGPYSDSIQVIVRNRAPQADAGQDTFGKKDQEISFSGSGTDKDGIIELYEWDFDGDGEFDSSDTESGDADYTYTETGDYDAVFRVTDDDGASMTDSIEVSIIEEDENLPPVAVISSPEDMAIFATGERITFDGRDSYDNDGSIVNYIWSSNVDGVLAEGDEPLIHHTFESGDHHSIMLSVEDNEGSIDSTTVKIIVNTQPDIVVDSPGDGERFAYNSDIFFDASSSQDPDDDDLTYRWTSNRDGELYQGTDPSFSEILSTGSHRIELEVADPYISVSSEITITVEEEYENQIPEAVIAGPDDSSVFLHEESISFSAQDSYDPDGEVVDYLWSSDIDGELYSGTSPEFQGTLSIGSHTITLQVEDDTGDWSEPVSVDIIVHIQPIARIVSIDPTTALDIDTIGFLAGGEDDGSIQQYEWTSSIDGGLYKGNKDEIYLGDLSIGEHTITLRVMDNHGIWSEYVEASLEIQEYIAPVEANIIPTVMLLFPAENDVLGDLIVLSGRANDEDGEIDQVELSIDGTAWVILQGTDFWTYEWDTQSESNGPHTISVRSYDGEDYSIQETVVITVRNQAEKDEDDRSMISGVSDMVLMGGVGVLMTSIVLVAILVRKKKERDLWDLGDMNESWD